MPTACVCKKEFLCCWWTEDPTKNIRGPTRRGFSMARWWRSLFLALQLLRSWMGFDVKQGGVGWAATKGKGEVIWYQEKQQHFPPLFLSLSVLRAPAAPGPIDDSAHNVAPPPRILLGQRRRRCSHNNIQFSFFSANLTCSATRWIVKTLSVGIQLFRGGQEILERHSKFNGDWIKSYI